MEVFSTEPKRWLFAFTHPDDEISICAWMRRLVRSGAEVWAGWSVSSPTREAEARAAMASIGIPGERLFFGGFPDQAACDNLRDLSAFWKSAIQVSNPARLASGAFECGHIDHDSTNFALHSANSGGIPHFEIPFYHTYLTRVPLINRFSTSDGQEVIELDDEERRFKRDFSKRYPSQNIGSLLVWYTILGWAKGRPAGLCGTERMRLQTHFDFKTPNLPCTLKAKVLQSPIWQRWVTCVEKFESD